MRRAWPQHTVRVAHPLSQYTVRVKPDQQPDATACPRCDKPVALCICDRVSPVRTRLRVVILQHPQEDDAELGTAKLGALTLPGSEIRVGLSWRSLEHALGVERVDRSRWAVLAVAKPPKPLPKSVANDPVIVIDRNGNVLDPAEQELEGILVLDGTWSQAKTLWWRNPWLLKLQRIVLAPREPARLGRVRREPRREALSTLEAASLVLRHAEPGPQAADALLAVLDRLWSARGHPADRHSQNLRAIGVGSDHRRAIGGKLGKIRQDHPGDTRVL
jgi:DTW domain-containing protein YfiP